MAIQGTSGYSPKKGLGALIVSGVSAVVLALVIGALQIAGVISMGLAHLLLFFAWVIGAIGIWTSEGWLLSTTQKWRIIIGSVSIFILGILLGVCDLWMVSQKATQESALLDKNTGGFLQFNEIDIYQQYSSIYAGKVFGGDSSVINASTEPVKNTYAYDKSYIEQADEHTDSRVMKVFEEEIIPIRQKYLHGDIQGPEIGVGKRLRGPITTRPLTADEAQSVWNGTMRIYFVSWWAWTNLRGHRFFSSDCRWLQASTLPRPSYKKENIVWHYCIIE